MQQAIKYIFLLQFITNMAFANVKEDVANTIVRVQSGNKFSTGFFWKNGNTVLTTLHSLSSVTNIKIYVPKIGSWKNVKLARVFKNGDLISLTIADYTSPYFLAAKYTTMPVVDTKAFTVGYNSGSAAYIDRDFAVGLLQGSTLNELLPSSAKKEIIKLGFPSVSTKIVYLKGSLLHGFSGSPVVDLQGKLIGIADGGLENGAAGISWCINSVHIANLESSVEAAPVLNQSTINSLFAAEEYEANVSDDILVTVNGYTFKKVKTRTFAEMDKTGDYSGYRESGFHQLLGMFQQGNINYKNFRYDVYVEQSTGATVVIPAGLELEQNGSFLTASSADDNFNIFINLVKTSNAQQAALNFESAVAQQTNTYNWVQDYNMSYLTPFTGPGGLLITRKAFVAPNIFRYGIEALAAKNRTFMGLFVSIDNQLNPANMSFYNATEVARYNLAVQLTTFTY